MPKFTVPVTVEIDGLIEVEAADRESAIAAAKKEYARMHRANQPNFATAALKVMAGPSIEVDFAYGEDPESVEDGGLDDG